MNQIQLKHSVRLNLRAGGRFSILYGVINLEGKQYKINTGIKLFPYQWNVKKQTAIISNLQSKLDNHNSAEANKEIEAIRKRLQLVEDKARQFLYKSNSELLEALKVAIQPSREISLKEQLLEIASKSSNRKSQTYAINAFFEFVGSGSQINKEAITEFGKYLISKGKAYSTAGNYQILISFLLSKVGISTEGYTKIKDSRSITERKQKQVTLTKEEIQSLEALTDLPYRERITRDIFLLQCSTGQRISDIEKIIFAKYEVLKEEKDIKVISFFNQKTKERVYIPINKKDQALALKLKKQRDILEILNSSTFNYKLRKLCKLAGIISPVTYKDKEGNLVTLPKCDLVHSHSARHSFITNCFNAGVSKEDITLITGHTSTDMLDKHYLHECTTTISTRLLTSFSTT